MAPLPRILGALTGLVAAAIAVLYLTGHRADCGALFVGFFILLAFTFQGIPSLRSFSFSACVLTAVSAALAFPQVFGDWIGFHQDLLIVPLTQIVMFGMGATLTLGDFGRVMLFPWPVLVGLVLHFTVMPLVAVLITKIFGFQGELAAGVILIGSVSAGMASNLMCYLAKGNVALSVTMTAFSTLAAPFLTPFLMSSLAGHFVTINVASMMLSIVNMILVPIAAGLCANAILYREDPSSNRPLFLLGILAACAALTAGAACAPPALLGALAPLKTGAIVGALMIGAAAAGKLVMSVALGRTDNWMDAALPVVSMTAITLVLGIITAKTREVLFAVGPLLIFASLLHNLTGYALGYGLARWLGVISGRIGYRLGLYPTPASRMTEADCRTVAIEVGMQNGGMATGLAIEVLKSKIAALPPAIFGTMMSITASVLANYWKRRPCEAAPAPDLQPAETEAVAS